MTDSQTKQLHDTLQWVALIIGTVVAIGLMGQCGVRSDQNARDHRQKMAEKGFCENMWNRWVPCADVPVAEKTEKK